MASGDSLLEFRAYDAEPVSSNFAIPDTIVASSADGDESVVPVLDFHPTINKHAEFGAFLPANYGGGGLTLKLAWTSEAIAGNVKWNATIKSFTDDVDNLVSKAFGAAPSGNTVTAGAPSAARDLVYDEITIADGADMNDLAAEEYFRLRLTRDAADALDTVNGNDAELVAIYIRET